MVIYSWRFLKRFAVLLPGLLIAYISVRDIFPYFDKRLPLGIAILATYILGAYVLIPGIIRLFRIIHPAKHLPLYCVTPDGFASDPLNIGIVATRLQLHQTMEQAGWYVADSHSLSHLAHQIIAILLRRPYLSAPVSTLYLFGRAQDIAFERAIPGSGLTSRHHVRFWATTYDPNKTFGKAPIRWYHGVRSVDSVLLWIGAASLDSGIAPIRHNLQVTHMIDPDTNQERELIVQQLTESSAISKLEYITLGQPYQLVNRALRGYLKTDGKMAVVHLHK